MSLTGADNTDHMILMHLHTKDLLMYAQLCKAARDLLYGTDVYKYLKALKMTRQKINAKPVLNCNNLELTKWYINTRAKVTKGTSIRLVRAALNSLSSKSIGYLKSNYPDCIYWDRKYLITDCITKAIVSNDVDMLAAMYDNRIGFEYWMDCPYSGDHLLKAAMYKSIDVLSYLTNTLDKLIYDSDMKFTRNFNDIAIIEWFADYGPLVKMSLNSVAPLGIIKWYLNSIYSMKIPFNYSKKCVVSYLKKYKLTKDMRIKNDIFIKSGVTYNINSANLHRFDYYDELTEYSVGKKISICEALSNCTIYAQRS